MSSSSAIFFILSLLYVNVFVLDFPGLSTFFVSSEQYFPVKLHASLMVGEEVHIFRSSGDTLTAIIPYRELLLPLMCMCEDHLNVYFKSGPKNINYFWIDSFFCQIIQVHFNIYMRLTFSVAKLLLNLLSLYFRESRLV